MSLVCSTMGYFGTVASSRNADGCWDQLLSIQLLGVFISAKMIRFKTNRYAPLLGRYQIFEIFGQIRTFARRAVL